MKKLFKTLNILLKDCKGIYIAYYILLFFSCLFSIMSTYSTKVLTDILEAQAEAGGTFNTLLTNFSSSDILETLFIKVFGGIEFLSTNLWVFAFIILGFALAAAIVSFFRFFFRSKFSSMMSKNMQQLLFYHIERLPYWKIKTLKNGDIIQTCTRDEDVLKRFFANDLLTIVYTFYMVGISFVILCITYWKIALVTIAIMPILFVYSFFVIKEVRRRYRVTDDSEGMMTSKIEENLASVRIVKAFNNEAFEINDFERYIDDYKGKYVHWRKLSSFFFASSDVLVFGQIALTTIFGFYLYYTGEIPVGTLVISFSFVSLMIWPIRDVATVLSNLARAMASLDRINLLLDVPLEDINSGKKPEICGDIEFSSVFFRFSDSDVDNLKNISFKVKNGQTVAIMGKTGSGKSTLAYLLTRLYDYTSGSIKINGHELKDIQKHYLREQVSIVLQEPFLFSKTIKDNIMLGIEHASNEMMIEATQIAHIDDSIRSFKKGYDTPVGEKGTTLSGGQKQRVAIARTLVKNSPILIFDDSLSAVDTETDYNIRKSLKERQSKSTTFIITHRVATAKDADLIIVLDNGEISEIGTHEDLIKEEGLYQRIYEIQTKMV